MFIWYYGFDKDIFVILVYDFGDDIISMVVNGMIISDYDFL